MKIVQAYVVRVDNFVFAQCAPQLKEINCETAQVLGMCWLVPVVQRGVLYEYQKSLATDKPYPDAIRCIIVKVLAPSQHIYYVAVADDATQTAFTDMCNACCGETPVPPPFVPPALIVEDCIDCAAEDGTRTWRFPLPQNPNELPYVILGGSFNGVYATPEPESKYNNADDLFDWLGIEWSATGAWTLDESGDIPVLVYVSSEDRCVGLELGLQDQTFCIAPPSSGTRTADALVFQIVRSPATYTSVEFPGGPVTYDATSLNTLKYVLSQMMPGTFTINPGPVPKLQYTGPMVPAKLQNGGIDVAGATFTAGVCANVYTFAIPANPLSDNYTITGDSFNGSPGTPAVPGGGWATTGAMLSFLNNSTPGSGWGYLGVWTIVGSDLILTSHDVYSASLTVGLI